MQCPKCGRTYVPGEVHSCGGVMRTSSVLIAAGATDRVYRSVADVPPELRERLRESTSGEHACTILIADTRIRGNAPAPKPVLPPWAMHSIGVVLGAAAASLIWWVFR